VGSHARENARRGVDGIVRGVPLQRSLDVHIVIAAWLFVIATMALTFASALGGLAFFVAAGAAPVTFYGWIKLRRLRAARREQAAPLEERVDRRDDADAGRDQQ
jgi:hypothetical protein